MDEHEGTPFDQISAQGQGPTARLADFYQTWASATSDAPTPLAAERQALLAEYRRRLGAMASGTLTEPPTQP